MSIDYYFVCDKCKEISENALTHNMSGGYILSDIIYNFMKEHFLDRICPVEEIRIVDENSNEFFGKYKEIKLDREKGR